MQVLTWDEAPRLEPAKGVDIRIIGNGMHATMCYIEIHQGAVVDWHGHPQEQMGTLIAGSGALTSGGKTVKAKPGTSWLIPPNEHHKFVANGPKSAIIIETFAPARVEFVLAAK